QTMRFLGQAGGTNFVSLSPDGQKMAVGRGPSSTSVWDVSLNGNRELLTIAAHEGKVYDAIYSTDGRRLASTGQDGTLRVWDAATGELQHSLPTLTDWVHFPAFSPDDEKVAAANQMGGVSIWDVDSGREVATLIGDGSALTAVTFNPDGSKLAAGGDGGFVYLWDTTTGQRLNTFQSINDDSIMELVFSLDGGHIYSYGQEGIYYSWNIETAGDPSEVRIVYDSSTLVCDATLWDAELSFDGRFQAVAGFDSLAHVFRIEEKPAEDPRYLYLHPLVGHEGNVTGVAFNPTGNILASSSFDGTVRLWDINSGDELSTLTDRAFPMEGVDFSPDGRHVVAAGNDGLIRVFVASLEELMDLARSRLSRGLTGDECRQYLHLTACPED
ncbi:MAG: WD40 repeat domain-containing protein, partial [Anaerolineales bacterium]